MSSELILGEFTSTEKPLGGGLPEAVFAHRRSSLDTIGNVFSLTGCYIHHLNGFKAEEYPIYAESLWLFMGLSGIPSHPGCSSLGGYLPYLAARPSNWVTALRSGAVPGAQIRVHPPPAPFPWWLPRACFGCKGINLPVRCLLVARYALQDFVAVRTVG
jgi:hypothetical protein